MSSITLDTRRDPANGVPELLVLSSFAGQNHQVAFSRTNITLDVSFRLGNKIVLHAAPKEDKVGILLFPVKTEIGVNCTKSGAAG
jgi:hypothetical protein